MKKHARVVVIGGGIAGCSTIYHLTQEGWTDVLLIERDELTSGTTWHSAAQVTNFGTNQTMIGLKSHSIALYKELSEDPDYPVSYNISDGGIRLAGNSNHLDGYHHYASMAKGMGVEFEVIDATECARRHPLLSREGIVGGLWDPMDGHIDPAQLCQALARRARQAGAEIQRKTGVHALTQRPDQTWMVHTRKGDIHCEIVVNAAGYRVNEVADMMGVSLPVVSMEHQYLVTESMPEIADIDRRVPLIRCPISDFYCRQEKEGLLVGFYEQECKTWGTSGIDPHFSNDLCPTDLDRIVDVFDSALVRIPALRKAGVHTVINGPITYTADGFPLVGKVPGRRNAYCIVGLRAGLGEGGGHGWLLAQLIAHGEACFDTWSLDPRRFGDYADSSYCSAKAVEDYQNEFRFHMPHEYRPAARFARTTGLTPWMQSRHAELVQLNGWERSALFPDDTNFTPELTFRRSNIQELTRAEVLHVHDHVGIAEVNGFNRIEISGPNAIDWLNNLSCSRVPRTAGKVGLCYFLNELGNVKSEATIANFGSKLWYGSAAASEIHDLEWLSEHLPADGSVTLRPLVEEFQIILLAGPDARNVLQNVCDANLSKSSLPWLHAIEAGVLGGRAVIYNLSYSGELAYEIHIPSEQLKSAWDALLTVGQEYVIRPFGSYAVESMRLEKSYRHWKADLLTEYNPMESGLGKFVDFDKSFLGRTALQDMMGQGHRRTFHTMKIDCDIACAQAGTSIMCNDRVLGTITSADFGYRTNKNLAMGYIDPSVVHSNTQIGVEILGTVWPATIIPESPFDPGNALMTS